MLINALSQKEIQMARELAEAQQELASELKKAGIDASNLPNFTKPGDVSSMSLTNYHNHFIRNGMSLISLIPLINHSSSSSKARVNKKLGNLGSRVVALSAKLNKLSRMQKVHIRAAALAKNAVVKSKSAPKSAISKILPCVIPNPSIGKTPGKIQSVLRTLTPEINGEEAMHEIATMQPEEGLGYESILSPSQASKRPQGFDAVYRDPKDGAIVIGEAKGGYNGFQPEDTLGEGFNDEKGNKYKQGTIGWVRESARATLMSTTANDKEREMARKILEAILKGDPPVRFELFHTPNNAGEERETAHIRIYPPDKNHVIRKYKSKNGRQMNESAQ